MQNSSLLGKNICTISNLKISTNTIKLIHDISLNIKRGQITTIVGESGSGKSLTAMAISKLLDEKIFQLNGEIIIDGINIFQANNKQLHNIRKTKTAYIFQNPEGSLNPNMKIINQMTECITQSNIPKQQKIHKIIQCLKHVEIHNPETKLNLYPFELSGGMQQRVCIAMALLSGKNFIIADEPTTALDVTIQKQILDIFKSLKDKFNLSILLITHNFGIVSEYSDYTYVMQNGQIVEHGDTQEIINHPQNLYTQNLLSAIITL